MFIYVDEYFKMHLICVVQEWARVSVVGRCVVAEEYTQLMMYLCDLFS